MATVTVSPPATESDPSSWNPATTTGAPAQWSTVPDVQIDVATGAKAYTVKVEVVGPAQTASYRVLVAGNVVGDVHQTGPGQFTVSWSKNNAQPAHSVQVQWKQFNGGGNVGVGGSVVCTLMDVDWGVGKK